MVSAPFPPERGIDPVAVRRQFDRRAPSIGLHDFLYREVETRLFERLEPLRLQPARVLEAGCGIGRTVGRVGERFPGAAIVGVDHSLASLRVARKAYEPAGIEKLRAMLSRRVQPSWICADIGALPFGPGAIDVVLSNLALHWVAEPHRVLAEWARVIRSDGLVVFSCFGPDTLRELRSVQPAGDVLAFVDMHDLGDMLVDHGFTSPVVDMERITLTYPSARAALAELRACAGNPLRGRARSLGSRARVDALVKQLDRRRGADGRLELTIEVTYGHAWRSQPRQRVDIGADGVSEVRVPFGALRRPSAPT